MEYVHFTGGENRPHYIRPGPGASISHEDDIIASATLGRYIRAKKLNRVTAIIIRNIAFNSPMTPNTPMDAITQVDGHRIIPTSNNDFRKHQMELWTRINGLHPEKDKRNYNRNSINIHISMYQSIFWRKQFGS